MPSPKIVLYFTPDIKETGRIPIEDIKFDKTKGRNKAKGEYEISLDHPCYIDGSCSSHKASIKSTATLTFTSVCFGEKTKYIFKVNDYFEIWDDSGGSYGSWCYYRGVVKQTSSNYQGNQRRYTISLENAGGWLLGDNSIYYLRPLIIAKTSITKKFFDPIKNKYGWLNKDGTDSDKYNNIKVEKLKTPKELLDTLINKIANVRSDLLKKDFYGNKEAIKQMEFEVGNEVADRNIFVANHLAEMEGSILDILRMFEGRPFSELFIIETNYSSKIIWRNTRWRDKDGNFCMGEKAGDADNIVTLYTDPSTKIKANNDWGRIDPGSEFIGKADYKGEREYAGIISETINKTNADVINAVYVYPDTMSTKTNVPALVIAQIRHDEDGAKNILDLDSIIRHGYKPITLRLPFIPSYMEPSAYSEATKDQRLNVENEHYSSIGQYLSEYTQYAALMYKNIQDSGNGVDVFQNNLRVNISDEFRIVRESYNVWEKIKSGETAETLYVNMNKITWYFSSDAPKTVFEWDRGFEKEITPFETDPGFRYA